MEKYWCLLTNEVCGEPPQAAPLPAGTGKEEALVARGDQMKLPSADCRENSGSMACAMLRRCLKQVQVAKSCRGARGGSGGAIKRSCLVNTSGRQVR